MNPTVPSAPRAVPPTGTRRPTPTLPLTRLHRPLRRRVETLAAIARAGRQVRRELEGGGGR